MGRTQLTAPVRTGTRIRRLPRRLSGYVRVVHPIPASMYVVTVTLLAPIAALSAQRALGGAPWLRTVLAVACAQVAIGSLNDYTDRALDRAAQRAEKPLVAGDIAPWEALALCLGATVLMLALTIPLGWLALLLMAAIEGLGIAYDLWFKGTPVSALLYAVYFPLIPVLDWTVFGAPRPFLPWVLPLGALLGVAMNVSNALPDLEEDVAAGVRGLPHLLGQRLSLAVAWMTPLAVAALVGALHLSGAVRVSGAGLAAVGGSIVLAVAFPALLYRLRPTRRTLRTSFYLQGAGVVLLAAGWLAGAAL